MKENRSGKSRSFLALTIGYALGIINRHGEPKDNSLPKPDSAFKATRKKEAAAKRARKNLRRSRMS